MTARSCSVADSPRSCIWILLVDSSGSSTDTRTLPSSTPKRNSTTASRPAARRVGLFVARDYGRVPSGDLMAQMREPPRHPWRPEAPPVLGAWDTVYFDFEADSLRWWDGAKPVGVA